MAKNTGLGRGLGALLSKDAMEKEMRNEEIQEGEVIRNLKLIDVEPTKNQPRVKFDDESLEALANSIKQYGVIQPIIVTKKGDFYKIVAGERRWRACKKAGLKEIPAIVREYGELRNKEIALIENIQREDLNPIEKARAIKELLDRHNVTQQKLSEMLGMARSTLTNSLRVLNLDQRVMDLALDGKLTEGHCKALLAIENPDKQYQAAIHMIESGDSVREAERQTGLKKKGNTAKEKSRYEAVYKDIEDSFRNFFGAKVKVNAGKRSGKIIIEYSSSDELSRIIELIK
ncbi:MAG: ParB/RepB/Spo0J family partition protein [Firmicutes bacterium]|nr:ParB/RepB/Spo0J family partition protein [Bacillota bacterium]